MTDGSVPPWLPGALELADVRRKDRVLLVHPHGARVVRAVEQLAGTAGSLTVVAPNEAQSVALAQALEGSTARIGHQFFHGHETYGTFDVAIVCPTTMFEGTLRGLAQCLRGNLRPGGRFVVDLPSESPPPFLAGAMQALHWDEARQQAFHGPSEEQLATALREAGLRRVEPALTANLLRIASTHDLAELWGTPLGFDSRRSLAFGTALASQLRSLGDTEVLVHRTRVHGIR